MIWTVLILSILIAIIATAFSLTITLNYNRFQQLKNGAEATLNQIRVALKKRLDLTNELLESVKSYARFERETLEKIVDMRTKVLEVVNVKDVEKIERDSRRILGNVLVAVENYPDLKTSQTVQELISAIREVEDEIARHRYTYNNIVQEFNTKIDTVPSNLVARIFGFNKMPYLELEDVDVRPKLEWRV